MWTLNKTAIAVSLWLLPQFLIAADLITCKLAVSGKLGSENAYDVQRRLIVENAKVTEAGEKAAKVETAFGTKSPILHSFEKEGLLYAEIAPWFPDLKPLTKARMDRVLSGFEGKPGEKEALTNWLKSTELNQLAPVHLRAHWKSMGPEMRWKALLETPGFFTWLTMESRSDLFTTGAVNFDFLLEAKNIPEYLTVGDDLGSYEVRLKRAIPNRSQFLEIRQKTEEFLDGRVGHQHLFHAWPESPTLRKEMAPYYIEFLDSSTWYLFWRQMNRNPENVSSILTHPYLGVYTTNSLNRLQKSVEQGNAKGFKDKFRMIGARSFPALEKSEDGTPRFNTDWEIRSGNKTIEREAIETMIEARLISGDYSGLKAFGQYDFSTQKPIQDLVQGLVSKDEVSLLKRFEQKMTELHFSNHVLAKNHFRSRIVSPLFAWENRLDLEYKKDLLNESRKTYAKTMASIARRYLREIESKNANRTDYIAAREEAIERLEIAIYEFTRKTRLDQDFQLYVSTQPKTLPSITVPSQGLIDVNQVALGIEYSMRFQPAMIPKNKAEAAQLVDQFAKRLGNVFGSNQMLEVQGDSHGHGVSVKKKVIDAKGETWRVEWDGIQRLYDENGAITNSWGGHTEIVTPKFQPQSLSDGTLQIYSVARSMGQVSSRRAGGAHVNFDIEVLQKLPTAVGTRKVLNLISYFESHRQVILHLWMHPRRKHSAHPINLQDGFAQKLENFSGDWADLGRFLYSERYFNTFVGRKPKYAPINLTALMTDFVPKEYLEATLDIKNKKQTWFPNFNKVHGRGEARFFDAPSDEYSAALQIKYFRALLNKSWGPNGKIPLVSKYSDAQKLTWKSDGVTWKKAVEDHLLELGLDPQEFQGLIWESYMNHKKYNESPFQPTEYQNFLPAR
jgi:hypothetical protein